MVVHLSNLSNGKPHGSFKFEDHSMELNTYGFNVSKNWLLK
jgi:hypothetical protein